MQVRSLDDHSKFITWNISGNKYAMKSRGVCRSEKQFLVGQKLQSKYPLDTIYEDVTIPGSRLSLDFFIPSRKLAVEVQGQQHFERNSFFHESNSDFFAQQKRDEEKRIFCEINNIKLIIVTSHEELT